jgi:hypothetical protein
MAPASLKACLLNCTELCRQLHERANEEGQRAASQKHETQHLQHELSTLSSSLKVRWMHSFRIFNTLLSIIPLVALLCADGCTFEHSWQHVYPAYEVLMFSSTTVVQEAETVGEVWQAQAQSALTQIERLKEMLSEGATWGDDSAVSTDEQSSQQKSEITTELNGNVACSNCSRLQQLALKHAAESAELELTVRALAAENTRAVQMASQVGRSSLPALFAIESRLLEMTS